MAASRRPSAVTVPAGVTPQQPVTPVQVTVPVSGESVFANDSTLLLIKKYLIYKLMASNLFINHSLGMMNMCYKIFGIKLTNFAINNTVASIFTSGETIQSLHSDVT